MIYDRHSGAVCTEYSEPNATDLMQGIYCYIVFTRCRDVDDNRMPVDRQIRRDGVITHEVMTVTALCHTLQPTGLTADALALTHSDAVRHRVFAVQPVRQRVSAKDLREPLHLRGHHRHVRRRHLRRRCVSRTWRRMERRDGETPDVHSRMRI